jgi:electron transfer flavoprotein alpha/beta subunit
MTTMNICVLVKPVYDPTSIQWEYLKQQLSYLTQRVHDVDLRALQWAIDYKEKNGAHVTVLSVMDQEAEWDQRALLKYPIDECIIRRVPHLETYRNEVAQIIVAELKNREFDVILTGSVSEDLRLGVTPTAVAELLGIPSVTFVHEIDPVHERVWHVHRKEGREHVQTFQVELPALIGVVNAIARKRYIPRNASWAKVERATLRETTAVVDQKPKVTLLHVTEPRPNIRYAAIPPTSLSAEKRLLHVIGLIGGPGKETSGKIISDISGKQIHFITEKLQNWLKED